MKTSCGRTYKGLSGNGVGIGNGRGPYTGSGRGLCGPLSPCGGNGGQGGSSVWPGGRGAGAGIPAGAGLGGSVVGGGMWFGGNIQQSPFGVEPGGGLKATI